MPRRTDMLQSTFMFIFGVKNNANKHKCKLTQTVKLTREVENISIEVGGPLRSARPVFLELQNEGFLKCPSQTVVLNATLCFSGHSKRLFAPGLLFF